MTALAFSSAPAGHSHGPNKGSAVRLSLAASDCSATANLLYVACITLFCRLEPGSALSCPDAYEVIVNEEVIVPLGPAVRASPLKARKRDEVRTLLHLTWKVDVVVRAGRSPAFAGNASIRPAYVS